MTIAELRGLIADLPDDMQIAVRGFGNGYDPLMIAVVRRLAPDRSPRWYDGILTEESVESAELRSFLAFGTTECADIPDRFDAAGVDGSFDFDFDEWYATGWSKLELPLFALEGREA